MKFKTKLFIGLIPAEKEKEVKNRELQNLMTNVSFVLTKAFISTLLLFIERMNLRPKYYKFHNTLLVVLKTI